MGLEYSLTARSAYAEKFRELRGDLLHLAVMQLHSAAIHQRQAADAIALNLEQELWRIDWPLAATASICSMKAGSISIPLPAQPALHHQ